MKKECITKIAALIYDQVSKSEIVDIHYLDKLIKIVVSYENLNKYIKHTIIDRYSDHSAMYDSLNYTIGIDTVKMTQDFFSQSIMLPHYEKGFYFYFYVSGIILHELEHAKQYKKCETKEDKENIEAILLKTYYYELIKKEKRRNNKICPKLLKNKFKRELENYNEIYKKYYNLVPSERLANIHAHEAMALTAKELNLEVLEQYEIYKSFHYCINAYKSDGNLAPTSSFLEQLGNTPQAFKIEQLGKKLSLSKRRELGLQITKEELAATLEEERQLRWNNNL